MAAEKLRELSDLFVATETASVSSSSSNQSKDKSNGKSLNLGKKVSGSSITMSCSSKGSKGLKRNVTLSGSVTASGLADPESRQPLPADQSVKS